MKINNDYMVLTPNGFKDFDGIKKSINSYLEFILENGKSIGVTSNHIFVIDNNEVFANTLKLGDYLETIDGKSLIIGIKEDKNKNNVFDLINVADGNIYYTNDILSHNCAFIGSGDNVVDAEAIRTQELTNVKNPLYKDREWDNELWIWQEPQKGHRYILGCLPENEMVLTNKGLVKAQNITFKNKLINKEGELVRIKNIQEYDVEDCDKYRLTIENTYRTTTFTHEHPIYCSKDKEHFDFIPIKNIKEKDWLKIPNIYNKELDYAWVENENYWWLIGILLSKGVFQKDDKRFGIYNYGINKNDIDKIKNILTEYDVDTIFSDEYTFIFRKDESEWDILYDIDDYNRYISEKIKYLPKQYKVFLLDGIITTLTKLKPNKKTTLIGDLMFLEGIQDILLSLGIVSKGYKNKLIIDKVNTLLLMDLLPSYSNSDFKYIDKIYNPNKIKNKNSIYFNDDFSYIYLRIKTIHCSLHTGKVYNYECETNSYMRHHIPTHNCDVSRGDSEDATGITIIDYDTYEQVAEYHGKIPPDIAAELVNKYGRLYNALSTFDITGGMGIVTTNKLKDLHYPRNLLHYDNITDDYFYIPPIDAIPGINFASRNRRSQIVAALEEAIVRGGFKLRSQRLAAELKKFIYRNGRPDHMKNSHDDLIMALGMCLFVGNTAFKRLQESDNLTKAMLDSWRVVEEPFFNKTRENIKEVLNTNPQEGKVYNNNDNGNNTLYNTKQYGWLFSTKKRQ